jgi:hypothetical protein
MGRVLQGREINLILQCSVFSLRKDIFLMYFQCIISKLYDFDLKFCFDRQTRFAHVAGSSAEKKLAEIGPCANTKTTFFNTRSCKN